MIHESIGGVWERDLSAMEESVFFLSRLLSNEDLLFEVRILDDLLQCSGNPRITVATFGN